MPKRKLKRVVKDFALPVTWQGGAAAEAKLPVTSKGSASSEATLPVSDSSDDAKSQPAARKPRKGR